MGFWDWVMEVYEDPERRARAYMGLWLTSVLMTALGYAFIANHYAGRLPRLW